MCGIDVPDSCEGRTMVGEERRGVLYGEVGEDAKATRMIHDGRHKLIWYPAGNRVQLFDLRADPLEQDDLSDKPEAAAHRRHLEVLLAKELYDGDLAWLRDGALAGFPGSVATTKVNRGLSGQRGCTIRPSRRLIPRVSSGRRDRL